VFTPNLTQHDLAQPTVTTLALLLQTPGTAVHWYGKEVQNKRKLGHITIVAPDNETAQQRLRSIDPAAADAMDAASTSYSEAAGEASHADQSSGQQPAVDSAKLLRACACACAKTSDVIIIIQVMTRTKRGAASMG